MLSMVGLGVFVCGREVVINLLLMACVCYCERCLVLANIGGG